MQELLGGRPLPHPDTLSACLVVGGTAGSEHSTLTLGTVLMESTLQGEWLPEGALSNEANSSQQAHAKPHTEGKEWAIKQG